MMRMNIGVDEVRVWYRFTESLSDSAIDSLFASFSREEISRCAQFAFHRDRRDFAAAHALLRRVLSLYADVAPEEWCFERDPGGKPVIASRHRMALTFNLSHTSGLVACAVAHRRLIGVDVEPVADLGNEDVVAYHFSQAERDHLAACTPNERTTRFSELWTLKESYLKAIGAGLSHPLTTFRFAFEGEAGLRFTGEAQSDDWHFCMFSPAPQYRLAVAVGPDASVECRIVVVDADLPHGRPLVPVRETSRERQS
jgi:4'-phosphopantetheinyl transferase